MLFLTRIGNKTGRAKGLFSLLDSCPFWAQAYVEIIIKHWPKMKDTA